MCTELTCPQHGPANRAKDPLSYTADWDGQIIRTGGDR